MKRPDLFEDETLLGALSDAIDHLDPVSPAARQAAIAACEIGSADAELAALVTESEVGEPVLLREEIDSASLTFRSSRLTIELDIDAAGHVVGLISPPVATSVEVETAAIPGTSGATLLEHLERRPRPIPDRRRQRTVPTTDRYRSDDDRHFLVPLLITFVGFDPAQGR